MSYSYQGFFRYTVSSGGGGIGIPVVSFNDPGTNFPPRLANILNDQDVNGMLYSAVSYGAIFLLLPNILDDPGENENHGKFADLRHLAQYSEKYGGSIDMSFSVEKYCNGKFISMYALRDPAATVRSIDLLNQSYVWYTGLDLKLPNATLYSDSKKIYQHQ